MSEVSLSAPTAPTASTAPSAPPPGKTAPMSEKEAYWRGHLERWQRSGLSQSAYSRVHGLRSNQLSYWHRREQRLNVEAASPVGGFVPLQVVGESQGLGVTVRLPSGVVLEGVRASDVELVRALVARL